MRRPAEDAAIALFTAATERVRDVLASGAPLSSVASFPAHPEIESMSLLLASYSSEEFAGMVRVEALVEPTSKGILTSGLRFELHAGRTQLGTGVVVIGRQFETSSTWVDKPPEPAWRGIKETLWAA